MSSRLRKTRRKKPGNGRQALRRIRGLISSNRLTLARIQRLKLAEMLTLANVLSAAHKSSTDPVEQENLKTILHYLNQVAQEKYGHA